MATNDDSSANSTPRTSAQTPVYHAMTAMFEAARKGLSETELAAISDLNETAVSEALRLAHVTAGIACLADCDARSDGVTTGIFQSGESVFTLLCALSHSLDTIAAMTEVGACAAFELSERKKQKTAN